MKRILELGLLLMLSSVPLFAAKNSYVFQLPADVRVGNVQLPKGNCSITWSEKAGSEVQLTITTADRKTLTIDARKVERNKGEIAVVTFVDKGITYLAEFDTPNTIFVVQNPPNEKK
jgi:hypothetical protein